MNQDDKTTVKDVINPLRPITLTIFEWHQLLNILEHNMCIVNNETLKTNSTDLWENISSQLSGKEQIMRGSAKHRRLYPKDFIKDEQDNRKTEELPAIKEKKKNFWNKIFG